MSKYVKELQMRHYRNRMDGVDDVIFVNVVGMEATATNQLRLSLRKKQIELQVVKNALARKVLEEKGIHGAGTILEGASAICWGGEGVVELAREIADWAKKIEKFQIKGACVSGDTLDAAGVDQLSKLPSRIELLGQIVNLIQSPGSNLVSQMLSPGGSLASQIKQLSEGEASAEAAPA